MSIFFKVKKGKSQRKGLHIVKVSSTSCPCCKSSEKSVLQLATSAEAIIDKDIAINEKVIAH